LAQRLLSFARNLRSNQTDAEKSMWSLLRRKQLGFKFKRQQPIDPYIVDFVCFEKKLVIEIDGGQHSLEKDQTRTDFLQQNNFQVLRFWNDEILRNKESVYQVIEQVLHSPLPNPLPQGERE